jgi:hypothetical protein
MDPIQFPSEFPSQSIRTLLDFVRGRQPFGRGVAESAWTVAGYGAGLGLPVQAMGTAPLADPAPLEQKVAEGLQAALDANEPGAEVKGLVPWVLIVEFAINLLLKKTLGG